MQQQWQLLAAMQQAQQQAQAQQGGQATNQQQQNQQLQQQFQQAQQQASMQQGLMQLQQGQFPQGNTLAGLYQQQPVLQQQQFQQQQQVQQQNAQPESNAQDDDEQSYGELPSTMVPPSVLASMFSSPSPYPASSKDDDVDDNGLSSLLDFRDDGGSSSDGPETFSTPVVSQIVGGKPRKRGRNGSGSNKKSKKGNFGQDDDDATPQATLVKIQQERGYFALKRLKSDDTGYDAVPSALQLASFGTHLVRAVHTSDTKLLSSLLECGLSPNPCNQFRDSIVDLVCKRANHSIFKCLLEHGSDLQILDGFGRTPLHHAAWASTFCQPIVEAILARDPMQLWMEDKHGQTPLEYVRADLHQTWTDFLESHADKILPMGGDRPPAFQKPKERRPDGSIPDPPHAISVTLAHMVSAGTMTPDDVMKMSPEERKIFGNNKKK